MSFSFSVQSLMISSRLLVLMLRDEVLGEPTSGGDFWFSFGNFIFSLDTNARAFPVFMMYRLLCANSRQLKMSRMQLGVVRVRHLWIVLVGRYNTGDRLGSSYPQYPSRVVLVICNASNGVPLVGFRI